MSIEKRKSTSVFFSEIVGYKSLMKVNEEEALGLLDKSRHVQKPWIESAGGVIIKEMGDRIMAIFPDLVQAMECSVKLQQKLNTQGDFKLRIGIHQGEVIFKGSDIYGDGVELASRLHTAANSGGVVVSEAVVKAMKQNHDFELVYIGERKLKNHNLPKKLYCIKAENLALPEEGEKELEILPNHNLPSEKSPFIGRQNEIEVVKNLVLNNRLINLAGSGGVGKTSLALVTVRELTDHFRDGVWFIELSGRRYMYEVVKKIAGELRIVEKGEKDLLLRITDNLHDKNLLLVLDNCDTSVNVCSDVVDLFIRKAPGVSLLITCRESLGLPGEILWRVPSMSFPGEKIHEPGWLKNFESVSLFIERAKSTDNKFELNVYESVNVGTICRYAEGIPLAIELLAGSLQNFDINDLALRIKGRFEALSKNRIKTEHRGRIVQTALNWSYELLSKKEKILFRRISIFPGRYDLTALSEICCLGPIKKDEISELLESLVSRFLVYHLPDEDKSGQYKMHLVIKSFGWEKLKEASEITDLSERYFSFFYNTIEQSYFEQLENPGKWIKWINHNSANIHRIFELDEIDKSSKLHLVVYLGWYYYREFHIEEGLYRLNQYFSRESENEKFKARALQFLGMLYGLHDEMIEAGKRLYESVKIWKKTEMTWESVMAMVHAGLVTCATDPKTGLKILKESLTEAEKIDHPILLLQIKIDIAFAYLENNQPYKAEPILENARSEAIEIGRSDEIMKINLLTAASYLLSADYDQALQKYKSIARGSLESQDPDTLTVAMQGIAMSLAGLTKYETAFRVFGVTLSRQHSGRLPFQNAIFWEKVKTDTIEKARSTLGIEKAEEYEKLGKEIGIMTAIHSVLH